MIAATYAPGVCLKTVVHRCIEGSLINEASGEISCNIEKAVYANVEAK